MARARSTWAGTVPVDDTALHVRDSGGDSLPIVYLNGAYADMSHWRRVIGELGDDFRHIAFDERARGRSKRSADYTFEACLRDIDAVLDARDVGQPVLLAGWSYGGILSWHFTDRRPERVVGVVTVDAFPVGVTGEEGRQDIRKLFHKMRFLLPFGALLGMGARMSADQHADVNIELNEISAASTPVLQRLTRPVRFVMATGDSLGSTDGQMDEGRASLDPILAINPNLTVAAKVPSNHTRILREDSPTVAQVIRELAAHTRQATD